MNIVKSIFLFLETLISTTFRLLSPILIVLAIWIIFNIIYRYKKYGIVEFNVFKKRKETKFNDIILSMIDKIDGYRKVYKPNNLYADLIIIDKTGIYLIKLIKYFGEITGNRKDKILNNRVKLNEVIDIDNPFYYLDQDLNKIDKKLKVNVLLVTNNTVNVKISNVSSEECLLLKDFYYYMNHRFKQEGIYTMEEIIKIYDSLSKNN